MKTFNIWQEGFSVTGDHAKAEFMGDYKGHSFKEACKKMVKDKGLEGLYDPKQNTVWGCRLFDNEEAARKFFG